jgi:hypothetical protein
MRRTGWLTAGLIALLVAVFGSLAVASDDEDHASRVPMPAEAKPLGDHCVEPTPFMKRNHMKLILHERNLTMHEGIRTKKYSLRNCINCHATPTTEDPQVRSVLGEGHFCQSCHAYNAVRIDCFECHNPKATSTDVVSSISHHDEVASAEGMNMPGLAAGLRGNQNGLTGAAK